MKTGTMGHSYAHRGIHTTERKSLSLRLDVHALAKERSQAAGVSMTAWIESAIRAAAGEVGL